MNRFYLVLFALLLSPALLVAEEGLVNHWTFDDDAPGIVKNSADVRFNAKVSQDFLHVEGVLGKAIDLSGQYQIEIPAGFVPAGLKGLTFAVWVAPRSLNGNVEILRKEDLGHGYGNDETPRLLFAFQDNGRFLTLGMNTGGNYAELDAFIIKEELLDEKWHHVAGTFDGKAMHVYLDGKEIGSYERQSPYIKTVSEFSPMLKDRDAIARGEYETLESITVRAPGFIGSSEGKAEYFDGKMDDLRFYNRALSPGEIETLAQHLPLATPLLSPYVKRDTFTDTLVATQKNVKQLDVFAAIALHRQLRNDFPNEVNNYIVKHQESPVETIMLSLLPEQPLRDRAAKLVKQYVEYMPITDDQWKFLTEADRTKWTRVKNYHTAYKKNEGNLFEIVLDMQNNVEDRPRVREAVAPYIDPVTPAVQDRTPEETRQLIEYDWMLQCGNKPTVQRSLDEINWARKLATRLLKQYPNQKELFDAELKQLDNLQSKAAAETDTAKQDKDLYFAVRTVKRDILFKNPVIDFDTVLYVDGPLPDGSEWRHETRHRLGYMGVPGGRLMTLKGLNPGGHQTKLMPQESLHGSFWRPDLSYDAKKVLVSFKPHNEKNFHLYEVDLDTKAIRQLTAGIFDDLDPIYLPDGKNMMFLTTRGHIYVRCMPPTNAFVLARMALDTKPGDKDLYIISRNGEPEYTPSVMADGRVIYTRWEYTDKPLWRDQSLWTMNADGTQVQTFWGNQSVWPDLLKDARQIPGSERVMFTGAGHHAWFAGCVGIIDPGKGFNFPDGLTKVTQELAWPESGNGPVDPKETNDYHSIGAYTNYYSPYPLSETDFLVTAERWDTNAEGKRINGNWVLLLMDINGNRELVMQGDKYIFDAMPLRPRKIPEQVAADRVDWPSFEMRDKPATGTIYSNNVYDNAPEELRGKAKFLRIWSIEHKTYTYWHRRNYVSSGPEISVNQSEGVKKIIGTVPIEDDGSISFTAPSGVALHFQLLDENQLALQTMKSFTGVLPGETRGCLGCHESMTRSPVTAKTGKALKRAPSNITPVPWDDITVGYERYVQPVLNKYCGECHQNPDHDGFKKFNAALRPGFLGFKEPYMTLMGSPTWGTNYKHRPEEKTMGGYGWADTILVESYSTHAPAAYSTYPAMTKLSYKSRLVERMMSGKHNGVKVSGDDLLRVILWVDAMGPYFGAEEVRCLEDPLFQGKDWISQRPRVMTAPIVQRPGPFDPFFTDSAYDTPNPAKYNALPFGVKR
ncbi:hypothetical protein FACS1894189_2140 [Planctomycetales bacterium]|nr:hypothetical protein FACS1894189_2140 [Planctomycetales bacterium]